MEIIMGMEYIMLIIWILGAILTIFSKGITKLLGSIFIAYATGMLFINFSSVFGSSVFLIGGVIISLSGFVDIIKKYV